MRKNSPSIARTENDASSFIANIAELCRKKRIMLVINKGYVLFCDKEDRIQRHGAKIDGGFISYETGAFKLHHFDASKMCLYRGKFVEKTPKHKRAIKLT